MTDELAPTLSLVSLQLVWEFEWERRDCYLLILFLRDNYDVETPCEQVNGEQLVNITAINAGGKGGVWGGEAAWWIHSIMGTLDLRSNLLPFIQEYQDEISTLTADLTSARDQNGVFMSKEKYQALMDQMNRQKRAIDHEKVSK